MKPNPQTQYYRWLYSTQRLVLMRTEARCRALLTEYPLEEDVRVVVWRMALEMQDALTMLSDRADDSHARAA